MVMEQKVETPVPGEFAKIFDDGRKRKTIWDNLDLKQDDVSNGLAKLVLAILELLRQLLERQAIRRMDAGSLTKEQTNNLGNAFLKLQEKMKELKEHFGLTDEDLNIDLGPLGKLLKD